MKRKTVSTLVLSMFLSMVWFVGVGFVGTGVYAQTSAQELYARYNKVIYRIDVITKSSGSKASLGTGFVVAGAAYGEVEGKSTPGTAVGSKTLATNYHVVSAAINEPELYKLEWESVDGRRGPLKIVAVDVVHDLALVVAQESMGQPLFTTTLPDKGALLFSLGHPLGLDLAIITGTANGLLEKSIYEKIHFSGNINPGMSGGPAINEQGEVVGVNVATAGEAVGFLVPAKFLDALLLRAEVSRAENLIDESVTELEAVPARIENIRESIGRQLLENQQNLLGELFEAEWETHKVGNFIVPDQISTRLDCWGNSQLEDDEQKYSEIDSNCLSQDSIYLSSRQRAGTVSYQFFWLESEQLSPRSFYSFYEGRHNSTFMGGADEKDVGNFVCSIDFVEVAQQTFKANVCARPYLKYPELVDFMVLMAMTGHEKKGFLYTLDLSTVTLDNAMRLYQRFLENFSWQG